MKEEYCEECFPLLQGRITALSEYSAFAAKQIQNLRNAWVEQVNNTDASLQRADEAVSTAYGEWEFHRATKHIEGRDFPSTQD